VPYLNKLFWARGNANSIDHVIILNNALHQRSFIYIIEIGVQQDNNVFEVDFNGQKLEDVVMHKSLTFKTMDVITKPNARLLIVYIPNIEPLSMNILRLGGYILNKTEMANTSRLNKQSIRY
jgi:hypothetical protein